MKKLRIRIEMLEMTTVRVVARPTPSAPPSVSMPCQQPTMAMTTPIVRSDAATDDLCAALVHDSSLPFKRSFAAAMKCSCR